jgi:Concanavalin A-like lectin/glucanases superfamily/Fibronectin type III domain
MSIIDSSVKPKTITLNNGASINTSKRRFGGGSLSLSGRADYAPNGGGPYASISSSTDFGFGTGDFTIEMWVYPLDCNNWRTLISIGRYDDGLLWRMGSNGDQLYFNGNYWSWGASSVPLNSWSHLALVRNNGGIKVFINGIASLSTSDGNTATNLGSSRDVYIGTGKHSYGSEIFNGYIDEVRITKGIGTARYSSNFDIKTLLAPFPSSGTPITPPEVITGLSGVPGGNKITLSWTPPSEDNGDAIINYSVQYASGEFDSWSDFAHSASSSSSIVVSGLTNGTSYLARVAPINIAGTGNYVSLQSSISPLTPPVLTITSQPLNDYSINYSSAPSISVSATMNNGDTPTYQWQGYFYNYNTDYYGWNNFTDQTSSSFTLTPSSAANNYNLYDLDYGSSIQIRCIVSGDRVESPITTQVVRWFKIDQQHYASTNWYTNNYNSPSWNGYNSPTSITLGSEENLNLDLYDYGYSDTSWYTGNDISMKIQISDNNSTWTDLYTQDFRGYLYLYNYQIPTSYGIKYYRIKIINKWPYTTNNGTGSVSHSPPYEWSSTAPYDTVRVTWPLPSQPLSVVADPGDTLVDVSWNAPTNSATTVTSYTVQYALNGGSWTTFGTSTSTSLRVTGLSNGSGNNYTFRVAATNSAGTGPYSAASSSVSPDASYATTPGVPTNITGIAGNTKVLLNWVAPSDTGKSALTDYIVQYSIDDGETWENYTDPTP